MWSRFNRSWIAPRFVPRVATLPQGKEGRSIGDRRELDGGAVLESILQ